MSGLLKYLLYALLLFIIGTWIFTVAKTCNAKDLTDVVENPISSTDTDGVANLDDLYSDEEEGGEEGNSDNSADGDSEDGDLYDEDVDEDDVAAAKRAAMAEADEKGDILTRDLDAQDAAVNKSRNSSASSSSRSASSSLKYLVVAASYLSEANAKSELRKLKNAGYDDAEIVVFDFSQYHTICAARYNSLGEANSVKRKLINNRYPDAYVHRKRKRKK